VGLRVTVVQRVIFKATTIATDFLKRALQIARCGRSQGRVMVYLNWQTKVEVLINFERLGA